jgi:hypothetical protein
MIPDLTTIMMIIMTVVVVVVAAAAAVVVVVVINRRRGLNVFSSSSCRCVQLSLTSTYPFDLNHSGLSRALYNHFVNFYRPCASLDVIKPS